MQTTNNSHPANVATTTAKNGETTMQTNNPAAVLAALAAANVDPAALIAVLAALAVDPAAVLAALAAADTAALAAVLAAAVPFDPECPVTPFDMEDTAADILAAITDPVPADPVPADPVPALAALAAHNAAPRTTYKVTADNHLARLTYQGVDAYYGATLDKWANSFRGSAYEVKSASTTVKSGKSGNVLSVVVETVNYGKVHLTTNSTTSIDYRRLSAAYVKRCDKRAAKSANKSANTGRRAPMSDVKRAAQAVNRYAAAACKRLANDKNKDSKVRSMVVNYLSNVCIERDVNRDDVIAALKDSVRAAIS